MPAQPLDSDYSNYSNYEPYQPHEPYKPHEPSSQQYQQQIHNPQSSLSDISAVPPPPPHRELPNGTHGQSSYNEMSDYNHHGNNAAVPNNGSYGTAPLPEVTPGADNLGDNAAGGGINGIARDVANAHERESGVQALRDINNWGTTGRGVAGPRGVPLDRSETSTPYAHHGSEPPTPPRHGQAYTPYGSTLPLGSGVNVSLPGSTYTSEGSLPLGGGRAPSSAASPFLDNPYNRYSSSNLGLAPRMASINPNEVADDDDWGMYRSPTQKRKSFIPFTSVSRHHHSDPPAAAAGVAAGAGAGTAAAATSGPNDVHGYYNAVPQGADATEKSEWLAHETVRSNRLRWIVGAIIVFVIIAAIVGGVVGGILGRRHSGGDGGGGNKASLESVTDDKINDLHKDSKEIQSLLNNKDFHKVFPGMDYTPLNAQYPECMHAPPSQNNVTRDMAILSQLTNSVRLYGTDCNQTEMVLHAIDRLELADMKVWLGVWIGTNETTNARQISQMWKVLDNYESKRFKGVIVGNEVLYRDDQNLTAMVDIIDAVKRNLTDKSIDLPIATADLGDKWTADLAQKVDIVMSNIHPFFAGVKAEVAAAWTWNFWTDHDVRLTQGTKIKQIISEVGWPSKGGNTCGQGTCTSKADGSVAGIEEMNTFMEDWVCPSLKNGTEYFWFEAFDEPWKFSFNRPGKEWEDQWGLMDVNRKLKDGVKIPDCGGQTAA
ncbi:glycoside hydrolase [Delitschia confertaspora ATCC 74209]|uniref:glucan endo-1,3-beta-D-glucosidase n=1 Tax=Delitschia confertaspora ATCC 74209 TaxID=1513339 RepID=A0A9P4JR28_9PLEO|nr:glycoside hydrolase [Delitschia confertaspora ATCC 74209]